MKRQANFFLFCLFGLLFLVACGQGDVAEGPTLIRLLPPDSSRLDPVVAEALDQAWREFEMRREKSGGTPTAQAYGRLGTIYHANHLLLPARDCYQNAIALDPEEPRWRYYLAYLLEESGETRAALEAYRTYILLSPDYLPARLRAADLQFRLGDLDDARSGLRAVLEKDPGNAFAIAGLGQIALAFGDDEEAVAHLSRALALQPGATRLYHSLGLALRGLGRTEEAAEAFARRGASESVFADPLLAELGALERSAQSYLTRATAAAQDGRYDIAARAYAEAVRLEPENPMARAGLAQALERLGRLDEALEEVLRVLELAPDYALARFQKGRLLERRGDDRGAVTEYRRALASDEHYAEASFVLANALMRLGDAEAAIPEYLKAAELLPESVLILYRLGLAQMAAARCAEATATLRKASDKNPSYGPVVEALVRNMATCEASGEGGRRQALEDGRWLYAQLPNARHAEALAMALAANGAWDRAVELQREALQASAKSGDASGMDFMRENLARFQRREAAVRPWPATAEVFRPPHEGAP